MSFEHQLGETFDQALAASANDDTETAIALFSQVAEQFPESPIPAFLMGAEFAQVGRIDEAMQAYASAVVRGPSLHIARFQLGLLQFTSGQVSMALLTWQPLLELGQDDPLPYFVLGFSAMAGNQFDAALGHFDQGKSRNTANAPLNRDIDMVIEKIREMLPAPSGQAGQSAEPPSEPSLDGAESHVLLSNYRSGSVH